MNTTQLLTLLANQPGISAGDIVEHLNAKLADVSAELRSLVDVGDVVKTRAFDEANGRQWFVYELSETFKASKIGQNLVQPQTEPAAVHPAPQVDQVEAPPAAAAPVAREQRGDTKVQKAIAFITANGPATDAQLRTAMDLPPKAYIAAYLKASIAAGTVAKVGDEWLLGTRPAIAPTPERRQANKGIEAREATRDLPADCSVTGVVWQGQEAPAAAPVHRCAIWSDGTYELQTDGARVALLNHDQAVAFVNFIERIGAAA